jgi:hypothetical protein
MKNSDNLLNTIAEQLQVMIEQLDAGFDVAPAQRLALEGLTAASLAAGTEAEILLQCCRRLLPSGAGVKLSADGRSLQFDLWQQGAPVYPTTAD